MKRSTDDYPAVYLIYVLLMFAAIGVATLVAALLVLK